MKFGKITGLGKTVSPLASESKRQAESFEKKEKVMAAQEFLKRTTANLFAHPAMIFWLPWISRSGLAYG